MDSPIADVFFSATHASYDLEKDNKPFRVPPNTYIVETQVIGDYCYISIDRHLWHLFQGWYTPHLSKLLTGKEQNAIHPKSHMFETFQNLIFYEPGDLIYNRHLTLYAGRENGKKSHRLSSKGEAWGFYNFMRTSEKEFIPFERIEKYSVLKDLFTELTGENKYISYSNFIARVDAEFTRASGTPRIFVFRGCANIESGDASQITAVEKLQRAQQLKLLAKTPYAFGGPYTVEPTKAIVNENNMYHASAFNRTRENFPEMFGEFSNLQENKNVFEAEPAPFPEASKPAPEGSKILFKKRRNRTFAQLLPASGRSYFTRRNMRSLGRERNLSRLFELKDGALVKFRFGKTHRKKRGRAEKKPKRPLR